MLASVFGEPNHTGTMAAPAAPERAKSQVEALGLVFAVVFSGLLIVQIANHDMWRDEIHSWGLVMASPTLTELYANLRFTGHPGLWYVLLWPATFVTDSPYAIQIVHALVGVSLIAVISLISPFSWLERLLLLASYFVLYEYTVITRSYGLGFLIALLYAHMRATRPDSVYANAILLGLLANTNMFAFVLSGAFALEYLVALLFRQGRALWPAAKVVIPPALLYLVLVAAAVATMWPSADISWRTTGAPLENAGDISRLLAMIAGSVEALIPAHALSHWDADAEGTLHALSVAALPVLAFVFLLIFKAHRLLLIIPAVTFLGTVAVGQLVYANSIRHWGVNFIAFVAAYWIRRAWSPAPSRLATGLLAVSAAAGIAISVQQWPRTFSEGRATAAWIIANGLSDAALVGTPDTLVAVVAQYLKKPIYFLDCSCTDTFLHYHKRRDDFDESQIAERLARATEELSGRRIVFLITDPLGDGELAAITEQGVAVEPLAAFDNASTDENFYVYEVRAAEPLDAARGWELRPGSDQRELSQPVNPPE